jgi:hypothetical protein
MTKRITPDGVIRMPSLTCCFSSLGTFLKYCPPQYPGDFPSLTTVENPLEVIAPPMAYCRNIGEVRGHFLVFHCSPGKMFPIKIELSSCCQSLQAAINFAKTYHFGQRLTKQNRTGAIILSMAGWDNAPDNKNVTRWSFALDHLNLFPDSEAGIETPPSSGACDSASSASCDSTSGAPSTSDVPSADTTP